MTEGGRGLLNARAVRWLDAAVCIWAVVWIALGIGVWHDIRVQTALSDSVVMLGVAIQDTGEALSVVGRLPLVGGGIADLADQVTGSGAEVAVTGRTSSAAIARLAITSGLAIGVLPAALVVILYLPMRLAWRRDVAAVAAALRQSRESSALDEYLARRALCTMSWARLHAASPDPWRAMESGEVRPLADAELARLGLVREPRE